MHRSGFVNIIGNPNVGKSTLMNKLVGEKMSIITNKPQTTRHRILGIVSEEDYQIVFSDTPGIIDNPNYGMQKSMNKFAYSTFEDADLMIFVTEVNEAYKGDETVISSLQKITVPKFLIINKTDLADDTTIKELCLFWEKLVNFDKIFTISALHNQGVSGVLEAIVACLPEGPEYYPKDQLTDKPERFFVSEIIREKILLLYRQEIPYSCEVVVESFKESTSKSGPIVNIFAVIYVSRKTQKGIIIGKGGAAIKKLGSEARKDIEAFVDKKVFLELMVKVKENWRDDDKLLKHFGYNY